MAAIEIIPAGSATEIAIIRQLFLEYADSIETDLCFQGFQQELATLPGKYVPPEGGLWLAMGGDQPVGCVALRKLEEGIGELKRLYVRPAFRGSGLGRRLTEIVLVAARNCGYGLVRLDTLASMKAAIALYESLGFRRIGPYCYNPEESAVYMEIVLG
jgi:ribosomal protein S18 acetylase RimI-like enzyme